jgi:hypothetical protein
MILEDDLRATLRERADQPAVQPDLLAEVRGGIRRANRRRAAVLGAAALLVAAIAVPVALTGSRSPAPPAPPGSAGWHRPRLEMPTFPLTPGWTPAGFGVPEVGKVGRNRFLSYESPAGGTLEARVGPTGGDWEAEGEDRETTVGKAGATMRTVPASVYEGVNPGDGYAAVRWQLPDGNWAQVMSTGTLTENDVLRFARGLRPGTVPASPAPFTVAAAPRGLVLQQATREQWCLAPPAALSEYLDGRGICITVASTSGGEEALANEELLTVGGRPATLLNSDEGPVELAVALDPEHALVVSVRHDDVPLTRDELVRFTEGVTVNP